MCPPGPARRPSAVGTEGRGWEWGGGGCSSGRGGHVAVQWPYPEPVVLLAVQRGIEEHFAAEFVDGEDAQGLLIHPRPLDAVDHPPRLLLVRLYLRVGGSRVGAGGCRPVPSPPPLPHAMGVPPASPGPAYLHQEVGDAFVVLGDADGGDHPGPLHPPGPLVVLPARGAAQGCAGILQGGNVGEEGVMCLHGSGAQGWGGREAWGLRRG